VAQQASKSDAGPPRKGGDRRRRRRKPRRDPEGRNATPAELVARVAESKPTLQDKSVEEPLSPAELAELKQHLRFLRDHRRVLHLRVNAQEDLLINEVREPTRRGVCVHLLSKVDRAHVFSAAERLEPAAATRLVEGILRISPNLDYLLLYLDCVRRSQSGPQAIAALAHALESIDFRALSPAQMRRVLDLIVELFDRRQLPAMLLGLLEGKSFRDAFDASVKELPEALAEIVVPLRAAQDVVLHKRPNRFGPDALARGVLLLLQSDETTLMRRAPAVRRRLLELALASGAASEPRAAGTLRALLDGLASTRDQSSEASRLTLELAREWVALGRDAEARQLLSSLLRAQPDSQQARRILDALDAPRLGRFALLGSGRESTRRRASAVWLDALQAATILFDEAGDSELGLWHELAVPGIAPLLDAGNDQQGRPWIAVARPGQRLSFLLDRRRSVERETLRGACAEAARLLATLAALEIGLPDARLARFELDDSGRLWLSDLTGAKRSSVESASAAHARLIANFCREVSQSTAHALLRAGSFERLDAAKNAVEAAQLLSRQAL
jgi:hypothetical protein